jgi:hypothetical protein
MTQPSFAPISEVDKVRPSYRLQIPLEWRATRAADQVSPDHPAGPALGVPGPDQGYVFLVAEELFEDRIQLSPGISTKDALHGCCVVASARAGRLGRAPVGKDVEMALLLFGFLDTAPDDLVEWRTRLFQGAAHDYAAQRRIVDSVPEDTLRLTADQVRERLSDWRSLVVVSG